MNLNVGILSFSPHAALYGDAVQTEAEQIRAANDRFARESPPADVVIVKATTGVGAGGFRLSETESFVFERGPDDAWHYTEKYDAQFARLGL